jgi:hypothetical protein
LAQLIGVTRVTMSRELSRLVADKVVVKGARESIVRRGTDTALVYRLRFPLGAIRKDCMLSMKMTVSYRCSVISVIMPRWRAREGQVPL